MALLMENAEYAVSQEGIAKLKADFEADFKRSRDLLYGQKYQELMTVINNNWSGADKDAYVQRLNAKIEELKAYYNTYYNIVTNALDTRYREFLSFQNRNRNI